MQEAFIWPVPDITINRNQGSAESAEANQRAHPHKTKSYIEILNFIYHSERDYTLNGASAKEYARHKSAGLNAVSGRFSELRIGGFIRKTGERREGSAVLALTGDGVQALQKALAGRGEFYNSPEGVALFRTKE